MSKCKVCNSELQTITDEDNVLHELCPNEDCKLFSLMNEVQLNERGNKVKIIEKSVFDLKSFDEVHVGIEWEPPAPFTTLNEALAYFGNDEAEVLKSLNRERVNAEEQKARENTPLEQWRSFEEDDKGNETGKLNGPADIQPANDRIVNDLVLNLAKQHFGFSKDISREAKQKAKQQAREFIKSNEQLKQALIVMSMTMSL